MTQTEANQDPILLAIGRAEGSLRAEYEVASNRKTKQKAELARINEALSRLQVKREGLAFTRQLALGSLASHESGRTGTVRSLFVTPNNMSTIEVQERSVILPYWYPYDGLVFSDPSKSLCSGSELSSKGNGPERDFQKLYKLGDVLETTSTEGLEYTIVGVCITGSIKVRFSQGFGYRYSKWFGPKTLH